MVDLIETGSPRLVGLKLRGRLHDEDYKQFTPKVETTLTEQDKVRMFVQFENFRGWDLRAAWDEVKFGLKHYSDFERIALVGDRRWEKWMANVCKPFTKAAVKYFDKSDVVAAWKWLDETEDRTRDPQEKNETAKVIGTPNPWNNRFWYGI